MDPPFLLQGPRAYGEPTVTGRMRSVPEDFRVDEILGFDADGTGAHMLVTVEKREANSGWVATQLAHHAGVNVREIGCSGHKDRHAVTQQAFSVPRLPTVEPAQCLEWAGEGYRVVGAQRHGRKLRPGSHRANRFAIRLRNLQGDSAGLETKLQRIASSGVPNYFGPQRFGRDGNNLVRALAWANGGAGPRDRGQRSFVLSAARSYLFNLVLAARVQRGDWARLIPGEAVMLEGRRSFFLANEIVDELVERCARMDVHPSGPLPGRGEAAAMGTALDIERAALADQAVLIGLLTQEHLEQERRSLRLPCGDMNWELQGDELLVRFTLPRGTFATAVLHELLADAWNVGEGSED